MPVALRVRLTPALKGPPQQAALSVLDEYGPLVAIGASNTPDGLAEPVRPSPHTLFGPRGACIAPATGALWISDTGHHRLLGWRGVPADAGVPADWVIGQSDFLREGRNGKGEPGAATLNVPTGVTPCGTGLAVADAWNHRVLVWRRAPESSHAPADVVLGQDGFAKNDANRGNPQASAGSLFWPYGVFWDGARLWVADTGNRRVLMWIGLPERSGQPADLVLGQDSFVGRNENGGGAPDASSMRWPHAVTRWGERLCVTDAGNNRVMVWDTVPTRNDQSCDWILGQCDTHRVDHNQSLYWPTAATLNMPYGVATAGGWLIVADTASSRLLAWDRDATDTGSMARALTGQADFHAKGDNRWQLPASDSLSWPYGVSCCDERVVVSDSGNNRVLVWRLSEALLEAAT